MNRTLSIVASRRLAAPAAGLLMAIASVAAPMSAQAAVPAPIILPKGALTVQQQRSFVDSIGPAAAESDRRTGVPASVTIAQAILESDWGRSKLSVEGKNYFGTKALPKPGTAGVVYMNTWEVVNGQNVMKKEPFRAYKEAADSFQDHGKFFVENKRYAKAMAARNDAKQFAREINTAGYATDPNYASKLISIMDRLNLYRFDV